MKKPLVVLFHTELLLHSLIATYEFEGSSVQIDGEEQTNSVSSNDFGKERVVSVLDEGGNGKDYLIRLHYHTGLPIVFLDIFDPESVPREEYITAEISVYGGLDFPRHRKHCYRNSRSWELNLDGEVK